MPAKRAAVVAENKAADGDANMQGEVVPVANPVLDKEAELATIQELKVELAAEVQAVKEIKEKLLADNPQQQQQILLLQQLLQQQQQQLQLQQQQEEKKKNHNPIPDFLMKFKDFDGSRSSLSGWLERFKTYTSQLGLPDDTIITALSMKCSGSIALRWMKIVKELREQGFDAISKALNLEFGQRPTTAVQAWADFHQLQMDSSHSIPRFLEIFNARLQAAQETGNTITEQEQIKVFCAALPNKLRREVMVETKEGGRTFPDTLQRARQSLRQADYKPSDTSKSVNNIKSRRNRSPSTDVARSPSPQRIEARALSQ